MSNNVTINPGTGGSVITTVDLDTFVAYPTSGELPASCLYVSIDTATAPTPVTNANPIPVGIRNSSLAVTQSGTWTVAVGAGTALIGSVKLSDGTHQLSINADGSINVVAASVVSGTVGVSNFPATQPVSAAALPLPTGAATATDQATANTSLSSIDSHITVCNTGNVTIGSALPAGTNALGTMVVGQRSDAIYNGTTALTPKSAVITLSASGDGTVIAAVTSKKLLVVKFSLWAAGAVNVAFKTGSGASISGTIYGAGTGPLASGAFQATGHFATLSGEALLLNLSSAVAVGGYVDYIEV